MCFTCDQEERKGGSHIKSSSERTTNVSMMMMLIYSFLMVTLVQLLSPTGMTICSASSVPVAATVLRKSLQTPNFQVPNFRCPPQCTCDTLWGKRRVSCLAGGLKVIPTTQMDRETNIIIFSGTAEHPHEAAVGRIFMDLPHVQQISITYSSLPMIGESTFWPGKELTILDLSNNRIDRIRDSDFNPLSNLKSLNLSDNNIREIPSASFRFLTNLTILSLARNRINKLVPRMFYKLEKLELLDLSENPLTETEITGIIFQDIKSSLKILKMEKSGIKSISHLTYQELPTLRELHLTDNSLSFIGGYEFTSLSSLKSLHLDGNRINIIRDNAFFGLRLTHLGLSRNLLTSLPICTFCNLQVESLDISSNRFTFFQPNLLRPLAVSLIALNAGSNSLLQDPSTSISHLLSPLIKVQIVKTSWNHINDSLPDDAFNNLTQLHTLDLSQNQLSNISSSWFAKLSNLESLDLSYNLIHGLDRDVFVIFESLKNLKGVKLSNNPWICKRCRILPLFDWIKNQNPIAYFNVCNRNATPNSSSPSPTYASSSSSSSTQKVVTPNSAHKKWIHTLVHPLDPSDGCVVCTQPQHLSGRTLHAMEESELEYCADPFKRTGNSFSSPTFTSRGMNGSSTKFEIMTNNSESRIGLILSAIMIVISCLIVMIVAVIYKFKQAAVYYTHEQESCHHHDPHAHGHGGDACFSLNGTTFDGTFGSVFKVSPNHITINRNHNDNNNTNVSSRIYNSSFPKKHKLKLFHRRRNHRSCDGQHQHQHHALALTRSCCSYSKNHEQKVNIKTSRPFNIPTITSTQQQHHQRHQHSSPTSSSSSSSSSPTSSSCIPSVVSSTLIPICGPFSSHSKSFTRKFTNSYNYEYKSPFKSPFKQCSSARNGSRRSGASNHSTSPLEENYSSNSFQVTESPTNGGQDNDAGPRVRF